MPIQNREGALYWATGIDNSGLMAGKKQAVGILGGLSRQITGMDIFAGVGIAAGVAFARTASELKKFSKEYEQTMREVMTISAAVKGDFEGYSDAIVDISKTLPQSANDLGKAYYQIVSAGYDGASGLKLLETSAKAAVGGVTDVVTAADGMTTVLNAWKLSTDQADEVADIFFNTVKLGKTTFGELAASMSKVAPLASAFGVSFTEVSASVATLTKQGTPTAEAMTQIRQALIALNKVLGQGWAETYTLQEGFEEIARRAKESGKDIKEFTGEVEGALAIYATTGKNAKAAAQDVDSYTRSLGMADVAFRQMMESEVNQSALLKNNIQAALKPIGDFLSGGWKELSKELNETFKTSNQRFKEMAELVRTSEQALIPMLSRYEELKRKTELSKDEQTELNGLIRDIGSVVPTAITSFDDYGKALDISAGKAQDWIDKHKAMLEYLNKEAIQETEKAIKKTEKDIAEVQKKLADGFYWQQLGAGLPSKLVTYTGDDIARYQGDLQNLQNELKKSKDLLEGLKGDFDMSDSGSGTGTGTTTTTVDVPGGNKDKVLNYYDELQKKIDETRQKIKDLSAAPGKIDFAQVGQQQVVLKAYENEMRILEDILGIKQLINNVEMSSSEEAKLQLQLDKDIAKGLEDIAKKQKVKDPTAPGKEKSSFANWLKDSKAVESAAREIANSFQDVSAIVGDINGQMGQMLSSIGGMINGIADLKAGNGLQGMIGIFGTLVSILTIIEETNTKTANSWGNGLERINRLLEEQQRIIDLSERKGGQKDAFLAQLKTEQDKLDLLKQRIAAELEYQKIIRDNVKAEWERQAMLGASNAFLAEMEKLVQDSQNSIDDLNQQITDLGAGFITEIDIADKIAEAFEQGKTSVEDFAEFTEDLLRTAVLESFKVAVLGPAITKAQEYLSAALADGTLSESEVNGFSRMMNEAVAGADIIWENLTSAMPNLFKGAEEAAGSLSGSIRASLTEETGSILAGTMNAMRLDIKTITNLSLASIDLLSAIRDNTNYNRKLENIDRNIQGMRDEFSNVGR